MSLEKPRIFNSAFAEEADPSTINTVPDEPNPNDIVDKPSLAAYSTGFPARSMVPPQAGGQPFYGQDVNGVLKDITSNIQYQQAGNYYQFDADFQKAIGGYNQYAVVLNTADGKLYQSLVDSNLAPLSDSKSWGFFTDGKYLPLSGGQLTGPLSAVGNVSSQGSFLSKGQNSGIYTQSKDNANGYCVIQTDDDLFIKKTENNTPASTIASYNAKTDTFDFNTTGLTKNTVPITAAQVEYWYVGGSEESPLIVEVSKQYVFVNRYGSSPVIFIPQVFIEKSQSQDGKARWVEINGIFDNRGTANDGLSIKTAEVVAEDTITYEIGIKAGDSSIVAPNRWLSQIPYQWLNKDPGIARIPFRIKVIKLF